jgi:membrane-bound lytic murein transglycosylase D
LPRLQLWVVLVLLVAYRAYGFLPLPYPVDVVEDESQVGSEEIRPREIQGYAELWSAGQLREMELPHFESGADVLGYKPGESFVVPPELKDRVEFWKKIYSEYTSRQALLHDSEHPEIIYEVVDISDIVQDGKASDRQKVKALKKVMKGPREILQAQLKKLQTLQDNPVTIPGELFPLFKKFEGVNDPKKFERASKHIRMQVGQRDRIVAGFLYGGRYFNKMMEIFAQEKMPSELTRLTLVESAFNLAARSKVGASGVWQFMRYTGKKFLRIDRAIDERNDPLAATWAAAQLLKDNYQTLGSWPLALTAYNHGREGMSRAVREVGSTELIDIIRKYKARNFGFASSNFYSEFLAVLEVEREYRKYFGKLMVDPPIQFEEFVVPDNSRLMEVANVCSIDKNELTQLNPALTDWVVTGKGFIPKGFGLKVPPGKLQACKDGSSKLSYLSSRRGQHG